ncbi:MAG: TIM barrel protein [Bryobacteraceae bacterium]
MLRRNLFLSTFAAAAASSAQTPAGGAKAFRISLAQWSLHRAIRSRLMTNLEFPRIAREQFGIEGLEFVNTLWMSPTADYVRTLKRNMRDTGTQCVLIMCDAEGFMGHPEKAERMRAVANHHKWVDIAAELGGHSIRTNMYPGDKQPSTPAEIEDFLNRCAESFRSLGDYAKSSGINVIIENHGGVSSNADVVVGLMKKAAMANGGPCQISGTFRKGADNYGEVRKMMPVRQGREFQVLGLHTGRPGIDTRYGPDDENRGGGGLQGMGGDRVRRESADRVRGDPGREAVPGADF